MKVRKIGIFLLLVLAMPFSVNVPMALSASSESDGRGWKLYTNARFGFSVRYPDDWRLGNPMPEWGRCDALPLPRTQSGGAIGPYEPRSGPEPGWTTDAR